jgi:hypothetical protein
LIKEGAIAMDTIIKLQSIKASTESSYLYIIIKYVGKTITSIIMGSMLRAF